MCVSNNQIQNLKKKYDIKNYCNHFCIIDDFIKNEINLKNVKKIYINIFLYDKDKTTDLMMNKYIKDFDNSTDNIDDIEKYLLILFDLIDNINSFDFVDISVSII